MAAVVQARVEFALTFAFKCCYRQSTKREVKGFLADSLRIVKDTL